jgi:nickel-type superoxide dismutase maturation protease
MRRVEVSGLSMQPTLQPGDRVVVVRPRFRRLRPGDVVAIRDPRAPDRLIVKRISGVGLDRSVVVVGDSPAASTDSRTFGPVRPALVVGRALYRYHPPERVGRVR